MSNSVPIKPRFPKNRPVYINNDLLKSSHIFVRTDSVKKPLESPYTGPFKVISRTDKNFITLKNGSRDTMSMDRCKPTYIEGEGSNFDPASDPDLDDRSDNDIYRQGVLSRERARKIKLPVRFCE